MLYYCDFCQREKVAASFETVPKSSIHHNQKCIECTNKLVLGTDLEEAKAELGVAKIVIKDLKAELEETKLELEVKETKFKHQEVEWKFKEYYSSMLTPITEKMKLKVHALIDEYYHEMLTTMLSLHSAEQNRK